MILAAPQQLRPGRFALPSAVTVLSAADPVRVFQNFATLDLASSWSRGNGRWPRFVHRVLFPLFGLKFVRIMHDLFAEKPSICF